MKLSIDTSNNKEIVLELIGSEDELVHKFLAKFDQAERLLPEIVMFLEQNEVELGDLQEIIVNNEGSSFTSLRIGVATANALAFGLDIPVKAKNGEDLGRFVVPKYDREPNITVPSKK
jgi:tRNA threonylcarbamoyladenosine biosynthesis protein TsaB